MPTSICLTLPNKVIKGQRTEQLYQEAKSHGQEFKSAGDLLQYLRSGLRIAISFGICRNFTFESSRAFSGSLTSVFKCNLLPTSSGHVSSGKCEFDS